MTPHHGQADAVATAALRQMATLFAPAAARIVERLPAPPREHKATPSCAEGGPHRYPPGTDPVCEDCGVTPGVAAVALMRANDVSAAIDEAFA